MRAAEEADAAALCAIYNGYVTASTVSFEIEPIDASEMRRRIAEIRAEGLPWLCLGPLGAAHAYAYAARWKPRAAYRHTVEVSVYVSPHRQRQGDGRRLYLALFEVLAGLGLHCALAGITLPNPASVAFHERLGFRHSGTLREVGRKFGRWIDVGYWQRMIGEPESGRTLRF